MIFRFALALALVLVPQNPQGNSTGHSAGSSQQATLARSFNGTTSDYLQSASALNFAGTRILSVYFVAYQNTNGSNDALFMESSQNYNTGGGGSLPAFIIDPNSGTNSGQVDFNVNTGGGAAPYLDCYFAQPSAATWHKYLLIWNVTTAGAGTCAAYVDGVSQTVTTNNGANEGNSAFANNTVYFMDRAGASLSNTGRMTAIAFWQADESSNASTLSNCTTDVSTVDAANQLYYWKIQQVSPETPTTGAINLTVNGTSNVAGPC